MFFAAIVVRMLLAIQGAILGQIPEDEEAALSQYTQITMLYRVAAWTGLALTMLPWLFLFEGVREAIDYGYY